MHFEISYLFSVPVCWLRIMSTMLFKPIWARHLPSLFASSHSTARKPDGKSMPSQIQYMRPIQWKLRVREKLAIRNAHVLTADRSKKKKRVELVPPEVNLTLASVSRVHTTPHTYSTHSTHCHHTCIDEGHKRDRFFALHFSRSLTPRLLQNQN